MADARTTTKLEHPLPPGMRDLLPEEAASRRDLSRAVISRLALHGYRLVTPPAFELASVLERGLGASAADDVIRFIEPESGEVAVLRPDMTPQVARMIATRLGDRTPPFRLAYEGTVLRRRASRAKKHRQIPQVGVELCGVEGADGDRELLRLAADVLREGVGLKTFTIDISDAGIVRELLADVPRATEISHALATKDEATLRELCEGLAIGPKVIALARLHGGREVIAEAVSLLRGTRAEAPAQRLLALFDAASSADGLAEHLTADPGEVRGLSYYTGTIFSIYAEGPGEPIGGGGRYDDLLERYGAPQPAVGLGLDLDALGWALRAAREEETERRSGVVVVGAESDPRIKELRARGVAAVAVADAALAKSYAASWGFSFVWTEDDKTSTDEVVRMVRTALGE